MLLAPGRRGPILSPRWPRLLTARSAGPCIPAFPPSVWLTFCAHAGVGVGPIQALGAILAGCARTLVHIILAQAPSEACSPGEGWLSDEAGTTALQPSPGGTGAGNAGHELLSALWPGLIQRPPPPRFLFSPPFWLPSFRSNPSRCLHRRACPQTDCGCYGYSPVT